MATEYPPLGKSYVSGYANNNRSFPIVCIRKDPRVENYKIPESLSPHPDGLRWPNHVFVGTKATGSDERVEWVYEIMNGPEVLGQSVNELGAIEITKDQIVFPSETIDSPVLETTDDGFFVSKEISPISSTQSRKQERSMAERPPSFTYFEVTQDRAVVKNDVEFLTRSELLLPQNDISIEGAIVDVADSPMSFPWVRRTTKSLKTNELGEIVLPPSKIEWDTITYTFPGIIYTWKARFTDDQVRANLSFFENRYPVSMTVAAKYVVTYHEPISTDPNDDPDLNLSLPSARNGQDFFRVITRPWARIFFNIPDNTIHPPAPITIAKESVDRGGVAFDISGGQSSEPSFYQAGDEILIGGEVKQWWGGLFVKRLVYVSEPI